MPGVAPGDLASISERQAEAGAQIGGHAGAEPQTVAVERRPVDADDFIEMSGSQSLIQDRIVQPETAKFVTKRYQRQKEILNKIKMRKALV